MGLGARPREAEVRERLLRPAERLLEASVGLRSPLTSIKHINISRKLALAS